MSPQPNESGFLRDQVWRVRASGEFWRITAVDFDGAGTYRVVLLDSNGNSTRTLDTVWGAELRAGADRACGGCLGLLEDDQPGPGCEGACA